MSWRTKRACLLLGEGTMSRYLHLVSAALLCSALPVWGQDLPEGKGREILIAKCNSCHTFVSRVGAGYTAEGWNTVFRMMMNHGIPLSADEIATLTPYLVKNFGEKQK